MKDIESGNGYSIEARLWLSESGLAADLLDALDIDPERVAGWMRGLGAVQLPLPAF